MSEALMKNNSSLSSLVMEFNEAHKQCEQSAISTLKYAKQAGDALIKAKSEVPHGQWLPWLEQNCECSKRTAQTYMKISRNWPALEAKAQSTAHLTLADAVADLSKPHQSDSVESAGEIPFPSEGNTLVGIQKGPVEDIIIALLESRKSPGYFYVSISHLPSEPDCGFADETKRPIQRDFVKTVFEVAEGVDPDAICWVYEQKDRASYFQSEAA